MRLLLLPFFILIFNFCYAQELTNIKSIEPEKEYENINVKKFYSDINSSYFIIWVKKEVKSHKHVKHTESIIVLDGKGKMRVGDKTFTIKSGDHFVIPENTFHSLIVSSKKPIKVISVQNPEFTGEDRVFENN